MTQNRVKRKRRSRAVSSLEAASQPLDGTAPVTREEFSAAFDRCFARVHAYVSRRVDDAPSCERVVSEVLEANLDLLVDRAGEGREASRLKAASDRLIGVERARSLSTRALEP